MKSCAHTLFVIVPLGIAALVGCATGDEEDPSASYLAVNPVEAGTGRQEGAKVPPPSNPSSEETPDAGDPNANNDGGGVVGGSCAASNSCDFATDLGTVSGDTAADTKSAEGYTSEWLTIRVTEDDHSVIGHELALTATLESPPGANFDLHVYVPNEDTRECTTISSESTSSSTTDTASVHFGESGLIASGSPDERTVTIEVRHVSGTCDPSAKWTLTVEGNK